MGITPFSLIIAVSNAKVKRQAVDKGRRQC